MLCLSPESRYRVISFYLIKKGVDAGYDACYDGLAVRVVKSLKKYNYREGKVASGSDVRGQNLPSLPDPVQCMVDGAEELTRASGGLGFFMARIHI